MTLSAQILAAAAFDEQARVAHLESIGVSRSDAEWGAQIIATEYACMYPLLHALARVAEAADLSVETTRNLAERERRIHEALAELRAIVKGGEHE